MSQNRKTETLYDATKRLLIELDTVDNAQENAKVLSEMIKKIVGNNPDTIESSCWYDIIIQGIITYYKYDEKGKFLILLSQNDTEKWNEYFGVLSNGKARPPKSEIQTRN